MSNKDLTELRDQFYGLSAIVSMMLTLLDRDEEIRLRLSNLETTLRQQNAPSDTIRMVRSCRQMFEG